MVDAHESRNVGASKDRSETLIVADFLSPPHADAWRRFACLIKTPEQMRGENEVSFANLRQLVERMRPGKGV